MTKDELALLKKFDLPYKFTPHRYIPIGMLQNDELFNLLCTLALSGGADLKTLFLVAHGAGIEAVFAYQLRHYGLVPHD